MIFVAENELRFYFFGQNNYCAIKTQQVKITNSLRCQTWFASKRSKSHLRYKADIRLPTDLLIENTDNNK